MDASRDAANHGAELMRSCQWLRGRCALVAGGALQTIVLCSYNPPGVQVLLAMGDRQFYFLLPKLPGKPRVRAKCESAFSVH